MPTVQEAVSVSTHLGVQQQLATVSVNLDGLERSVINVMPSFH